MSSEGCHMGFSKVLEKTKLSAMRTKKQKTFCKMKGSLVWRS